MSERDEWRAEHAAASREVVARLARVRIALDAWFDDEDALRMPRPAPERWSPREILEHVALTNHFLLVLCRKIHERSRRRLDRGDPWPTGASLHVAIGALARERTRWPHPEHMTPSGERSPAEVRAELAAQLAEAVRLAEEMPSGEGTLHRIRMSRIEGEDRLGLVEFLDVLARHAERHLVQLAEAAQG